MHPLLELSRTDYRHEDTVMSEESGLARIKELLQQDPTLCVPVDGQRYSCVSEALLLACSQTNARIVSYLLQQGPDVTVTDSEVSA